jgi:hypothetical protein
VSLTIEQGRELSQRIYERARDHLLAQGQRSQRIPGTGECLYRGPRGLKCAVGCLITDEAFRRMTETAPLGLDVNSSSVYYRSVKEALASSLGVEAPDVDDRLHLLVDLQRIHDEVDVERWTEELRETAARHGLVP